MDLETIAMLALMDFLKPHTHYITCSTGSTRVSQNGTREGHCCCLLLVACHPPPLSMLGLQSHREALSSVLEDSEALEMALDPVFDLMQVGSSV